MGQPMLVVASVANNTLEEYAKELSTTVDSAAGAIISGPQVQHLDDLIDRARRLALGLQVLLLVSLAGLFVVSRPDRTFTVFQPLRLVIGTSALFLGPPLRLQRSQSPV